jgi:hypothetical protein
MRSLRSIVATSILAGAVLAGCLDAPPTSMPGTLDRLQLVNVPLSLDNRGTVPTEALLPIADPSFSYVAAVAPPVVDDVTVQATNFAIDHDHGYVVYNNAGSQPIAGGLDVLDMSQADAPRLIASLVDTDAEFADVAVSKGYVFAVGADSSGGILRVWDVQTPSAPTVVTTVALGAEYGTSMALDNDTLYATFGTSGGLVTIDVSDPRNPTVVRAVAAPNALSVVHKGANNLVLYGDTSLRLEGERDGDLWPLPTLADAPVAAPGRMVVHGERAYVNAGTTGLTTLKVTGDGDTVEINGHLDLDGTGNGIDASSNLLFLAQGEAGIQVYSLSGNKVPSYLGRAEFPDDPASMNQVRQGTAGSCTQLLIGSGLGGFRIVSFTEH